MGNIGTAIAFFGAPAIVDRLEPRGARLGRRGRCCSCGACVFYRDGRNDPPRGAADALPRGAPLGLAAVPARVLLLHHLRRLRRDGVPAADAAAGLVRLLEGRGERARRRLHHRRDVARPVGGWLADRVGAYPVLVLVFAGVAIDAAVLAAHRAGAPDRPGDDRLPHARRVPRAGNGAVFKLVPARVPERRRRGRRASSARPAGSAASSRRSSWAREGRRGHVRATGSSACSCSSAVCLALAVWLLRNAPARSCAGSPREPPRAAPLLRRVRRIGRRLERAPPRRPRVGVASTATAGSTTGSSARPTASTAPAPARGRSTSRTGSSPGRPSRPTTRRTARTSPSTSRAAARAAPRSAGTSTRRSACATRTCAACCSTSTARRSRGTGDPVEAWADDRRGPREGARATSRCAARAASSAPRWDEVADLIAAAHVHTIRRYGPDRVAGFSPIPAMSMVSYAAGTRFLSLIGGVCLSFYDWYADLPPASPQIWGDQTDVPESADWWNAGYVILWGSNIPQTRTPDAHFMTEARYRGQKVVVVSPDFAGHTKFADHWLPAAAGSDGALAMAMAHVILKEFYVERQVPYFERYARENTDLPFLVTLREREGAYVADRFLRASDLGDTSENAEWKTVVLDERTGEPGRPERLDRLPLGRGGDREVEPRARRGRAGADAARAPRRARRGRAAALRRRRLRGRRLAPPRRAREADRRPPRDDGVRPARRPARRPPRRASRRLARGLRRCPKPYTPAWQEEHTGVDAGRVTRVAREFARNAERTNGRSMIVMGAGTNHWFHSDQIYRAMLSLVAALRLPGRERRRLGALRRPGEGAPDHRAGRRSPSRSTGTGRRASRRRRRSGSSRATSGATSARGRASTRRRSGAATLDGHAPRRLQRARRAARLDAVVPDASTATRSTCARRGRRRGGGRPTTSSRAEGRAAPLRRRGPRRARELPARAHALAREPARLLEQGARVLPPLPARRAGRRDPEQRGVAGGVPPAATSSGARRRRPGSSTCSRRSTSA